MNNRMPLNPYAGLGGFMPSISTSGPEFHPKKHPYQTYGAQQRAAKRRKRSKNHKK